MGSLFRYICLDPTPVSLKYTTRPNHTPIGYMHCHMSHIGQLDKILHA